MISQRSNFNSDSTQTIEELKHHSCLHYGYLNSGCQWKFIHQGREESVTINSVLCSNNGEVLRDAAVKGLGIIILPYFIIQEALKTEALKVILPNYQAPDLTLSAIYPVNRHLSTKIQLFTQFLQENFT